MAEIIWDSELGPEWPDDWSHTTVHAQFVAVTGDGADTDRLPDIAPSGNGEVIFTPSLRTVRYVGTDGPYVVSLKQYRAVVDNEGYLCTPDTFGQPGERGIVLPSTDAPVIEPRGDDDNAFTWRVDFDLPAVTIRSDHISVPVGGPYDLVDLLSPERAAGVVHIIDRVSAREAKQAAQEATAARDLVLPARDQTLAARDETLAHGITVDTSVGTRVFVGNTMIHGDTGWRLVHTLGEDIATSGQVLIRRVNDVVEVMVADVLWNDTSPGTNIIPGGVTLGVGFAQRSLSSRPQIAISDSDVSFFDNLVPYIAAAARNLYIRYVSRMTRNSFQAGPFTSTIPLTGSIVWTTTERWPTSLPGTPV